MLRTIPKFDSEAQYVLAKAKPLGDCRQIGDVVSVSEIGDRRARQAAEQFLILPTYVKVAKAFDLSDRKLRAGQIVPSEELGASVLKRYLGLKLRPCAPPAAKTPATAGKGRKVQ